MRETTAAHWEVHLTGAPGVWRVAMTGSPPWGGVAVYYYEQSGRWLCQVCQTDRCEHVRAVQATNPVLPEATKKEGA